MPLSNFRRILILIFVLVLIVINVKLYNKYYKFFFEAQPLFWCSSTLSLDKLTACIDNQYKDSHYARKSSELLQQRPSTKETTSISPITLTNTYTEISDFTNLKKENNFGIINSGFAGTLTRTDQYEKLKLHLPQTEFPFFSLQKITFPDSKNKCQPKIENVLSPIAVSYWKYPFFRPMFSSDLLITKDQKDYRLYAAGYEVVPLKDKKGFFTVSIMNFCPQKDRFAYCGTNYIHFIDTYPKFSDTIKLADIPEKYKKQKGFYEGCPPYPQKFTISSAPEHPEQILHLSADRRKNPSKLYVKLYNRIFAVDLRTTNGKGKTQ